MNPFTFGNPIKDPARFHGREAEIRQITNRLLSSAHESTSIIGERRIGKTSLLYHLAHPEVRARLGLTPDKFCLIYADFQGLTDITPTSYTQAQTTARTFQQMAANLGTDQRRPARRDGGVFNRGGQGQQRLRRDTIRNFQIGGEVRRE